MENETELLTVEGSEEEIAEWKQAVSVDSSQRSQARKIKGHAGDPDTWVLVAEVAKATLPAVITAMVTVFGQRKIRRIKFRDLEAEDVTAAEFERLVAGRRDKKK